MTEYHSFKVVLKGEENGEKNEIKKFVMRKDVGTKYSELLKKICSVFPQLKDAVVTISWTDEEGDSITIGTDEELTLALEEMPGPIYKLFVCVKTKTKAISSVQSHIHYGVTCDGCGLNPIKGKRYKCVTCADYDLCGGCKDDGRHPGHLMRLIDIINNIQSDCALASPTHYGITCDGCGKNPIQGIRHKCTVCDDYDLCAECKVRNQHPKHAFMKIDTPTLPFGLFSPITINKVHGIPKKQNKSGGNSTQVFHYGVTCDACEKTPIVGNRYKCAVCADYDLCQTCKAAGRHPGHKMNLVTKHPGHKMNLVTKQEAKTGSNSPHGFCNGIQTRYEMMKNKNSTQFSSINAIKKQREALAKIQIEKKEKKMLESSSSLSTSSSPTISLPSIPECPVCLEDLKPPLKIFNCRNGHLICSVCKPKVDICTNCREEYTGRATAIEQMLREMFDC